MAERQGWRTSLSLTAVGIVGALLGSAVQQTLTFYRERSTTFQQQQREAYVAFLNAQDKSRMADQLKQEALDEKARASQLKRKDRETMEATAVRDEVKARELRNEFELEAGAALRRIAIYGDKRVVEAIAEYSRQVGRGQQPCGDHWEADFAMYKQMREVSLGRAQTVSARDLAALSIGCKPVAAQ
jgi:hypothetical protein